MPVLKVTEESKCFLNKLEIHSSVMGNNKKKYENKMHKIKALDICIDLKRFLSLVKVKFS